jgi:hypothetical protein
MAISNAQKLVNIGLPSELAKVLADIIAADIAAITPSDITGFDAAVVSATGLDTAVEAAVAAKTEVAALTGGSSAADIVTALQA